MKPLFLSLWMLAATSVPAAWAQVNDHLQCFRIQDPLRVEGDVDLLPEQFGLDERCKIKPSKFYCMPASKLNEHVSNKKEPLTPLPYSAPPLPGDQICYTARCPDDDEAGIPDELTVTDQFGTRDIDLPGSRKTRMMCTPANQGAGYCGDGIIEAGEACDGSNLNGQTCASLGYDLGGTLSCDAGCKSFDTGSCRGPQDGLRSEALWSVVVCEVFEDIPLIYPDTQACYLLKEIPARTDVAYKVEFDLPWATYTSTTMYADTKPIAYLADSDYLVRNDDGVQVPNPYQSGNLVDTPRSERNVTMHVTPDYDSCVSQGEDNCIATNTNPQLPRNLIFQRVYFPNRMDPETDRNFMATLDYDRMGYTWPGKITCVLPSDLDQTTACPRFPLLQDLPLLNVNIGRIPPPNLYDQAPECPNRLRWDRPQQFWTHWAEPGASTDATGETAPDPSTTCTGYLMSMIYPLAFDENGQKRTEPTNAVTMTYVQTPPTFFDVTQLTSSTLFPNPSPDVRYAGIQNYGTEFSDVRYNEQSASVNENPTFPNNQGVENGESWVFLHYSRPAQSDDERTIKDWGRIHNVRVQQLAIYDPSKDSHPPFMIYRYKELSEAFQQTSGDISNNVPCYPWVNPSDPTGPNQDWNESPLSNAASATQADGVTPMMGTYAPVSIVCEYTEGGMSESILDDCLQKLLATNPSWFNQDGSTTCDPNL